MIYEDTDSINAMQTKLNSLYGRTAMMNNNYIVIHESDSPVVIFKYHIVGIKQSKNRKAEIFTRSGYIFRTDEDYATVVKLIF